MIEYINIEDLNKAIATFDNKVNELYKKAFTQGGPPPPPVTQQPPMDPAMAQGGMPPMDPAMAQGGMPPMDPAQLGGQPSIGPELEKNLTALFGGVEQMSLVITQQQDLIQTMSTRLLQIELMLDEQNKALQSPAGFEG